MNPWCRDDRMRLGSFHYTMYNDRHVILLHGIIILFAYYYVALALVMRIWIEMSNAGRYFDDEREHRFRIRWQLPLFWQKIAHFCARAKDGCRRIESRRSARSNRLVRYNTVVSYGTRPSLQSVNQRQTR